jgi:hypothetical protein
MYSWYQPRLGQPSFHRQLQSQTLQVACRSETEQMPKKKNISAIETSRMQTVRILAEIGSLAAGHANLALGS